jgi:hypothetical protein
MRRDMTTGPVFSNGWWVSIDVLRDAHPPLVQLAHITGLPIEQVTKELEAWATGIGLPYGVNVDVEKQTYECVPVTMNHEGGRRDVEDDA